MSALLKMSSNATKSTESAPNLSQQIPSSSSNCQANDQANGQLGADDLEALAAALSTGELKKQLQTIRDVEALKAEKRIAGEAILVDFVRDRMSPKNPDEPTAAHGSAYQLLYSSTSESAKSLIEEFPDGLVCPQSDKGIDYSDLQMLLVGKEYQAADKLTNQKLCELAGESAVERKWVYFTEVSQFPIIDLRAMDVIWSLYSEDKFGWRKQQALWTRLGKDWDRLWIQMLWKSAEGSWTRYPNEFIWDLASAPPAHLPLSNQLRGVRAMSSLLCHPAWHPDQDC